MGRNTMVFLVMVVLCGCSNGSGNYQIPRDVALELNQLQSLYQEARRARVREFGVHTNLMAKMEQRRALLADARVKAADLMRRYPRIQSVVRYRMLSEQLESESTRVDQWISRLQESHLARQHSAEDGSSS